ncbi:hypothetical protein [Nisaea sp.]|uniref:hypothetical protein n=1 Tax=Nisaea sp. TaxID=2024842 RepID=UPI003B52AF9A
MFFAFVAITAATAALLSPTVSRELNNIPTWTGGLVGSALGVIGAYSIAAWQTNKAKNLDREKSYRLVLAHLIPNIRSLKSAAKSISEFIDSTKERNDKPEMSERQKNVLIKFSSTNIHRDHPIHIQHFDHNEWIIFAEIMESGIVLEHWIDDIKHNKNKLNHTYLSHFLEMLAKHTNNLIELFNLIKHHSPHVSNIELEKLDGGAKIRGIRDI